DLGQEGPARRAQGTAGRRPHTWRRVVQRGHDPRPETLLMRGTPMADDNKPTALVPYEAFKNELVARQDEIAALLPSTISKEQSANTAMVAVKQNPELLECDRRSLHKAVTAAAMDGMRPDAREGVILPQKEKVTVDGRETWVKTVRWQPMAHGIR